MLSHDNYVTLRDLKHLFSFFLWSWFSQSVYIFSDADSPYLFYQCLHYVPSVVSYFACCLEQRGL